MHRNMGYYPQFCFLKHRYTGTHMLRYSQTHMHKCVHTDMDIISGSKAGFDPCGYHAREESVPLSEPQPDGHGVAWIRS